MVAKVLITVIVAGLLISAGIYVVMRIHTVASDNREQAVPRKAGEDVSAAGLQRNLYLYEKHNTLYGEAFRKVPAGRDTGKRYKGII